MAEQTQKKQISLRLSLELDTQLDQVAKSQEMTKSALIIQLLEKGLGNLKTNSVEQRLAKIEQAVAEINGKLDRKAEKTQTKTATKSSTKAETKTETKAEAKTETKAETKTAAINKVELPLSVGKTIKISNRLPKLYRHYQGEVGNLVKQHGEDWTVQLTNGKMIRIHQSYLTRI